MSGCLSRYPRERIAKKYTKNIRWRLEVFNQSVKPLNVSIKDGQHPTLLRQVIIHPINKLRWITLHTQELDILFKNMCEKELDSNSHLKYDYEHAS